jgi:hypothetical protein
MDKVMFAKDDPILRGKSVHHNRWNKLRLRIQIAIDIRRMVPKQYRSYVVTTERVDNWWEQLTITWEYVPFVVRNG